jgi:virulence-associated protein VagC
VRNFCGLTFPEAVTRLLGGETGVVYERAKKAPPKERKPFALPPAHSDMRRADGVRTLEPKQKQADAWTELALGCAKAIIGVQADGMKQTQDREQREPEIVMA